MASDTPKFQGHWLEVDAERMARYEEMFAWNPATAHYYDAADIRPGHRVADFGCGPGHQAIKFADWVGEGGHVHALDINADFIRRTKEKARVRGIEDRVSAHLVTGNGMPLADASLHRIVTRNTLIYVDDPVGMLGEFRRCLGPGGIAHAIEGDWRLTAVEPVPTADWREFIEAASWAWPRPEIGRQLYGMARAAGFEDISVNVLVSPDMSGRLHGMIKTVAGYAREGGMRPERVDNILAQVEQATREGSYLAIAPQFIVTATRH